MPLIRQAWTGPFGTGRRGAYRLIASFQDGENWTRNTFNDEQIAADGCIGLVMACVGGTACNVAPFGGRQGAFGTNPMAWEAPSGGKLKYWVADFATADTAAGKIEEAVKQGAQVSPGHLLDASGQPTTDPSVYYNGRVMRLFGGHKGYAMSLLIEVLGRFLVPDGLIAGPKYQRQRGNWTFMTAWSVEAFVNRALFRAATRQLEEALKAIAAAPGYSEVMLPGENSSRIRAERKKAGIHPPVTLWNVFSQTATHTRTAKQPSRNARGSRLSHAHAE